jgi:hypothetical protein
MRLKMLLKFIQFLCTQNNIMFPLRPKLVQENTKTASLPKEYFYNNSGIESRMKYFFAFPLLPASELGNGVVEMTSTSP